MNLAERLIEETRNSRKRVVVIGDAMTDHWVHGYIDNCQDGCPRFVEESRAETPGGAANAYRCIGHWNVDVSLYSYPKEDYPHKWRFINPDGKIIYRWDDERKWYVPPWSRAAYNHAMQIVEHTVAEADAVLLSDYDKGFLTPEFIKRLIDTCNDYGVVCVADVKRGPELYVGAITKANGAWNFQHRSADVVTWGPSRPVVDGVEVGKNLPPVKCINHVGAGDCFAAHLALAIAYGFSLAEAAALAHSAGRVYVQHPHNLPPWPEEVVQDMG